MFHHDRNEVVDASGCVLSAEVKWSVFPEWLSQDHDCINMSFY